MTENEPGGERQACETWNPRSMPPIPRVPKVRQNKVVAKKNMGRVGWVITYKLVLRYSHCKCFKVS
jgi:hypothetical protein